MPSEQLGLYPGSRRSFFFRIKSNLENADKEALNGDQYAYSNYKATNGKCNTFQLDFGINRDHISILTIYFQNILIPHDKFNSKRTR